ncbi:MAG TPA: N-acetylmuramoyl-L-alanine amidase, partial [Candidatus Limisoma gallistercoris]|nr:N-acetylmuramoyl-L-alanine amidase [Candidatus Limisoma gallistercoris]
MKKLSFLLMAVAASLCVNATDLKDLKIYINPGHGGHDSDDRNVAVPPFASGDPEGYWESNSNLSKGLSMRDLLEGFGVEVMMSRTTNTSEDDRDLEEIGVEATNFGADFFFSIHSNATGTATKMNKPLMLYREYTDNPKYPEAKEMAETLNYQLLENEVTSWSDENIWLAGDWSFYPQWGLSGLGVLRRLDIPGLLSEGSYHDYIPETYRLLNDDFCWLEAYHFTKAIMEHFQTTEKYSTGVVAGTVTDDHQERTDDIYNGIFFGHDNALPVCGATVALKDADGGTVETYTTDDLFNGVYMFRAVQPGTYTLAISHPDYEPFEQQIT